MNLDVSSVVATIIKQNEMLFERFVNIYIFGSIINADRIPRDIDVLLIYEKYISEIQGDLIAIQELLNKEIGMFVDLTVISIKEEKEISFLDRLKGRYLKLK